MERVVPQSFSDSLAALLARRELSGEQMRAVMLEMVAGTCGEAEIAALLTALRMKGETASELAAAAAVLREQMVRVETGRTDVLDTCGTGGDETGSFNVSTAAALVAAAAGVPVVKHGNRAVSSRSGSIDVLTALGVGADGGPDHVRRCLEHAGIGFCFAQRFHPALRHVAAVRRRLRFRTLFNCLGPLLNPAGAAYQLLGVGRPEWLDPLAGALAQLGTRHALLVRGQDGMDEVSLAAPTLVREVTGLTVRSWEWSARDFGLAACGPADLAVDGPDQSAALIRSVLEGRDGPGARVVLANAAAALVAAEQVHTLAEAVARARDAIDTGRARHVLERLVACRADRGETDDAPAL
jgi:anthranilate phosphoribosyltransferase